MPNMLVWVDLETTGLRASKHVILEIGAIATTPALEERSRFTALLRPDHQDVLRSDSAALDMHRFSGLLEECLATGVPLELARDWFTTWLKGLGKRSELFLAGSSVHFDRGFLAAHMPEVEDLVYHRMVDVSGIQVAMNAARGESDWSTGFLKPAIKPHRSMQDLALTLQLAREQWPLLGVTPSRILTDGTQ